MRFQAPYFFGNSDHGLTAFEVAPARGRRRIFLVAIQGEQFAPAADGETPYQRLHVMEVDPGEAAEFPSPLSLLMALPEVAPRAILAQRVGGDLRVYPRRVKGEILQDDAGQVYERLGPHVRPLHRLVSGPHGEILELTPDPQARELSRQRVTSPAEAVSEVEISPAAEDGNTTEQEEAEAGTAKSARPVSEVCRKLFPDPGQRCLVRWGDFKAMLSSQLAHPERLRESHRLACCAQVYEITKPVRAESLAACLLGDALCVSQLQPLEEAAAVRLGLSGLPRFRRPPSRHFRRVPGWFFPSEFVLQLQPTSDPTSDEGRRSEDSNPQEFSQCAPEQAPAGGASHPYPAAGLKSKIPERFLKPWEFKLSREEALYRMTLEAAARGPVSSWLRRFKNLLSRGNDVRLWQILLQGKHPEEQLWAVRPPEGGLSDRAIRDWAKQTLARAGYDAASMLVEWEIYWRRKGAS